MYVGFLRMIKNGFLKACLIDWRTLTDLNVPPCIIIYWRQTRVEKNCCLNCIWCQSIFHTKTKDSWKLRMCNVTTPYSIKKTLGPRLEARRRTHYSVIYHILESKRNTFVIGRFLRIFNSHNKLILNRMSELTSQSVMKLIENKWLYQQGKVQLFSQLAWMIAWNFHRLPLWAFKKLSVVD